MKNIKAAIETLVPGALYNDNLSWVNGRVSEITYEDYQNLEWHDERDKPTWEELGQQCFDLLKEQKLKDVDDYREYKLTELLPYEFPNKEGHIQLRNERDNLNILYNFNKAQVLKSREENKIIKFRDYENINHELTPDEMIDMCLSIFDRNMEIHNISWQIKEEIKQFEFDLEDMEGSYMTLYNYDISEEWNE